MRRSLRRLSFNPRARVGRDELQLSKAIETDEFQSTRPRGARLQQKLVEALL